MSDSVTQGQFGRFHVRNNFIAKGRKKNVFIGYYRGNVRVVVFHYHKDSDIIPIGTLSALSAQLGIARKELTDSMKGR